MKSRWLTIFGAMLIPALLVAAHFYNTRSCGGEASNGSAVWVPHLNMCAATVSEGSDDLVLDLDTICGSQEWDCQYIYRSPLTGKPLVLPDFVNVNFTPNSYPVTMSPDLKHLMYVERNETQTLVHVYDLVNQVDHTVASFGFEVSSLFDFEWAGNEELSFVTLDYNSAEPENLKAERYSFEWHDEMWRLSSMVQVEGGEVVCNPIYCELK